MWTVIHIANTREAANNIKKMLMEEGFLVKIKPISKNKEDGICEILVTRTEAEEVHSILFNQGL